MVSLGGISRFGVRSLLTVIFLLAGANKVTELSFFPGVYDELTKKFDCYGKQAGVDPEVYKLAIGTVEIVLALLLWFQPGLSSFLLLVIMGGAVGTHILCGEPFEGALVPAAFLLLHLLLIWFSPSKKVAEKKKKTK